MYPKVSRTCTVLCENGPLNTNIETDLDPCEVQEADRDACTL